MKDKHKHNEDKWFRENERLMLEHARKEREQQLENYTKETDEAEREQLRLAHWLKCPKCGNDMHVEKMDDIEIERCTVCNGFFFDAGELESLLKRKHSKQFSFYKHILGRD